MSSKSEQVISYQDQASEWAELAQQDPEAFEEMRLKLIADLINNAPAELRKRLEGIQWKVEHVRKRAKNPADALFAISNMMWESTQQMGHKQQALLDILMGRGQAIETLYGNNSGKILDFKQAARQ